MEKRLDRCFVAVLFVYTLGNAERGAKKGRKKREPERHHSQPKLRYTDGIGVIEALNRFFQV